MRVRMVRQATTRRKLLYGLGACGVVGGIMYCVAHREYVSRYRDAYHALPRLIEQRRYKHTIVGGDAKRVESSALDRSGTVSVEPITIVDVSEGCMKVQGPDGGVYVIEEGVTDVPWTELLAASVPPPPTFSGMLASIASDTYETACANGALATGTIAACLPVSLAAAVEHYLPVAAPMDAPPAPRAPSQTGPVVHITMGVRKALHGPLTKLGLTHAVVLVKVVPRGGARPVYAVYGYNSGALTRAKPLFMVNDMENRGCEKVFRFYNELTITGGVEEAQAFFRKAEAHSNKPYRVLTWNCFSPIFSAMVDAPRLGFAVPDYFLNSLLVAVPFEQNYGAGITWSEHLRPYVELAAATATLATRRELALKAFCEFDAAALVPAPPPGAKDA
eukprot:TRINITY_DN1093_c0_g1_i2.p1 TRINITY_DN1093_c0_g1~~TRINITY_DN1093_c0_g1_i2.p1  ORF type:complete len:390 (+),score=54.02 TRINITY_DN1093_c0_g1_i2:41-1210(+)